MKKQTLLTPIDLSVATKVGKGVYRKQVLPLGSINYRGRKIDFTKKYLTDLASSFKSKAYDQVPVVYADSQNQHNMDPRNFGADTINLAFEDDGLYAYVKPDSATRKVLDKNPNLGVSARIVEGLEKSDGRRFPRAIQHILLTMDPRVTGMKPWQTVDLSGYDGGTERVVDLTALTIEKESKMPKIKSGGSSSVKAGETQPDGNGVLDLSNLTDEQLDLLLSEADPEGEDDDAEVDPAAVEDDDEDDDDAEDGEDDDEEDDDDSTDLAVPAFIKAAKDEKAKRLAKDKKKGAKGRAKSVDPKVDLSSDKDGQTLDLSETLAEVRALRAESAANAWKAERGRLVRSGVPPHILDLAAPILSAPESVTIDLSTSEKSVDAKGIVKDIIEATKGYVDLTPELGHAVDLSDDPTGDEDPLLAAWESEQYA